MKTSFGRNLLFSVALGLAAPVSMPLIAPSAQLASERINAGRFSASGEGMSLAPIVSGDGHYVLFASTAGNLALTTNGTPFAATIPPQFNVFLRDRWSNTTTMVGIDMTGLGGGNGDSSPAGISTDGRFVLFESYATNLVPHDFNRCNDVFIRDLVTGQTSLVSVNSNGISGNGKSFNSVMTPDGRYVAFTSEATDLVGGDTNGIPDVFVRDMQTGITRCAMSAPRRLSRRASRSHPTCPVSAPMAVTWYFIARPLILFPG